MDTRRRRAELRDDNERRRRLDWMTPQVPNRILIMSIGFLDDSGAEVYQQCDESCIMVSMMELLAAACMCTCASRCCQPC